MRITATLLLFLIVSFVFSQELELVVPVGHTGVIQGIEVSPDKDVVASFDDRSHVIIWDNKNNKQLYNLEGHTQSLVSIQFMDNGTLLSAGADGQVFQWNVAKAQVLQTFSHNEPIAEIEASRTHLYSLTSSGMIFKWDIATSMVVDSLAMDARPTAALRFGNQLMVGDDNGTVYVIDTEEMDWIRSSVVSSMSISALHFEGNEVYVGTHAGELMVLDQELAVIKSFSPMDLRIYDMVINEESAHAFVVGRDSDALFKMVSLEDGAIINSMFTSSSFSPDQFAIGSWSVFGFTHPDTLLVASPDYVIRTIHSMEMTELTTYAGKAHPVHSIALSAKNKMAIGSSKGILKEIDLEGIVPIRAIPWGKNGIRSVNYHPLVDKMVSVGDDGVVRVSDNQLIESFNTQSKYLATPVRFDPTGQFVIRKNEASSLDVYDYVNRRERKIKSKDGFGFDFSADGSNILVRTREGVTIYETSTLKKSHEISIPDIQDFSVHSQGFYALLRDDQTIQEYSYGGQRKRSFSIDDLNADKVVVDPSGTYAYTYKNTVTKGQTERDYSLTKIDLETERILGKLIGHTSTITGVDFYNNGAFVFTSSLDGTINLFPESSNRMAAATLISLGEEDMVVVTPDGLYDATQNAMKSLHYVKEGQIISLEQFKNSLYEPNLLPRLLGLIDDPLPNRSLGQVLPHPEMKIMHPNLNNGMLGVQVEDNGGGIGEIVIIINGKEVSRDVRDVQDQQSGQVELNYQIAGHPYLKGDGIDRVVIKAYNKDGTMSTSERSISVFPDSKRNVRKPRLFALIAGTSDYEGEALDLSFAAKDAEDFARALQTSAVNQFGVDNVSISLLTTNTKDPDRWPSKTNIDSVFTEIGKEANALDYLVIYLSGHGVNDEDFYYLTADARDPVLEDMDKESLAISSTELTNMIKRVAALKQVLILDACHSGRFANDLLQSESIPVMETERIKAMERMKDRMGLYVLAGSKADAVSYEADLFEQGLLTYSILYGMKGAAMSEERVDVIDLFQFVQKNVPELAADIGGIQRPEVRYPANAESFSLGVLESADQESIELKQTKPVFTLSSFQEETQFLDVLEVGTVLDKLLMERGKESDRLTFIRKPSFSSTFHVKGRYSLSEDKVRLKARLYRGDEMIDSYSLNGNAVEVLVEELLGRILLSLER